MPAPRTPAGSARDRILDTAFRLFYAHGPRGVGVDTVIAESGVAKATLYKHFPRKDDLVLAYLDRVDQAWFGALRPATPATSHATNWSGCSTR
ncbi:TetR/AcrR family transcriptional regulator [Micromonospora parva]|uniref:TetR/AcrR family transcriptional regulator n=1 Tax=Micromonospora parva TaxID=1464048 RepID=UPI0033C6A083